jgi:hypothetical protein
MDVGEPHPSGGVRSPHPDTEDGGQEEVDERSDHKSLGVTIHRFPSLLR